MLVRYGALLVGDQGHGEDLVQEALVLRYWAGLSEREIATQLGCSTGTVKSRASRGMATLRSRNGPLADAFTLTETG
jgi:RNA polymerase sigma factor (sigma-70 family)